MFFAVLLKVFYCSVVTTVMAIGVFFLQDRKEKRDIEIDEIELPFPETRSKSTSSR